MVIIFTALFLSLFLLAYFVCSFSLFQINYGLVLYLKFARVDVGNVSKKGEIWKVFIDWIIFGSFFSELCLDILIFLW